MQTRWTKIKRFAARIRHYLLFAFFPSTPLSKFSSTASQPKLEPISIEAVTDEKVSNNNRTARLISEEKVSVNERYNDWLAALLKQLPQDVTFEEFKQVGEGLADFSPQGKLCFSLADYLSVLANKENASVEYAHYCHASRQPAIDFALTLLNQDNDESHIVEPSSLLIHNSSIDRS